MRSPQTHINYRFGPFELDSTRRRLSRDGEPLLVSDRHLEILSLLAANAGQVISKDESIEAAWKDVAVAHRRSRPLTILRDRAP